MSNNEILNDSYQQFTIHDGIIVDAKMYEVKVEIAISDFKILNNNGDYDILPIDDKQTFDYNKRNGSSSQLPHTVKEKLYAASSERAENMLPALEKRVINKSRNYLRRIIEQRVRSRVYEKIMQEKYKDYAKAEETTKTITDKLFTEYFSKLTEVNPSIRYCEDLTISSPATMIGKGVFAGKNLKSVVLDDKISIISADAFANNDISYLSLPKFLGVIGDNAFANNKLKTVEIPDHVTSIKAGAFADNEIQHISFPANSRLTYIGEGAFANNLISKVVLPREITKVKDEAFDDHTQVILPEGVILLPNDNPKGKTR